MFDVHAFGIAIRIAIVATAILLALRYVLRPTLIEVFRQRVFGLRRQLFLDRLDGKVSPDEPSYRMMMLQMNAVLRFADAMTFGRLILMTVIGPGTNDTDELDIQLAQSSTETQKLLGRYRVRLGYEIVRHILLTSPLAWGFIVALLPVSPFLKAIGGIRRGVINTGEKLGKRPIVKRLEADAREMLPDDFAKAA